MAIQLIQNNELFSEVRGKINSNFIYLDERLNDNLVTPTNTWSSSKINTLISTLEFKEDENRNDITTLELTVSNLSSSVNSQIDDNLISPTSTWSSTKIQQEIAAATAIPTPTIGTSTSSVWMDGGILSLHTSFLGTADGGNATSSPQELGGQQGIFTLL